MRECERGRVGECVSECDCVEVCLRAALALVCKFSENWDGLVDLLCKNVRACVEEKEVESRTCVPECVF